MNSSLLTGIGKRSRGKPAFFTGKLLESLLEYLAEPGSTYEGAAKKFRCAKSTVEKTIYRLREDMKKGPAPSTSATPDQAKEDCASASQDIVAHPSASPCATGKEEERG